MNIFNNTLYTPAIEVGMQKRQRTEVVMMQLVC